MVYKPVPPLIEGPVYTLHILESDYIENRPISPSPLVGEGGGEGGILCPPPP